jgi:hypothetical protein
VGYRYERCLGRPRGKFYLAARNLRDFYRILLATLVIHQLDLVLVEGDFLQLVCFYRGLIIEGLLVQLPLKVVDLLLNVRVGCSLAVKELDGISWAVLVSFRRHSSRFRVVKSALVLAWSHCLAYIELRVILAKIELSANFTCILPIL